MSDALINGLAGAGGGIVAQLITYPLQTVNTRQQTERKPQNAPEEDLVLTSGKRPARPTGTVQQMYQVIREEGWGRLYSGLMPSLVGTAASQGVYYYFYQIFRNRVEAIALNRKRKGYGDGSVGMFSSLLVAAFSGCLNVLLTNPIWVVVTRMQTHTKTKKKLSEARDEEHTDPDSLLLPIVVDELIQAGSIEAYPYGTGHAV